MTLNKTEITPSFTAIRAKPKRLAVKTRPRVSKAPWFGFTKHDWPRDVALDRCPSALCRRSKACLAAYDELYCRRTHHSPKEIKLLLQGTELTQALDMVPRLSKHADDEERELHAHDISNIRQNYQDAMTARWKAGEFDHVFGPYHPRGVMLKPLQKIYVELD